MFENVYEIDGWYTCKESVFSAMFKFVFSLHIEDSFYFVEVIREVKQVLLYLNKLFIDIIYTIHLHLSI